MLDCKKFAARIKAGNEGAEDGLVIIPEPDIGEIEKSGEASVTLRLGRWFIVLRQSSQTFFDVKPETAEARAEASASKRYFVPFGEEFILQPGRFVLASTLEWIRLPATLGGYVVGKSTWGRRGLVVETAAGIHPGFNGCLTLELANVGEVPIKIRPGMRICQVFVHPIEGGTLLSAGPLTGRRRPGLGILKHAEILDRLSK